MNVQLQISAKRIALFFSAMVLIVLSASILITFYRALTPEISPFMESLFRVLNVDHEVSVPAWYSASALLFSALLLWLISMHKARQKARFTLYWRILAIVFVYLSADEAAMLHENLLTPVGVAMNSGEGWAFPWVFPALVLVGVFALLSLPFLLHLPRRTMILFVVSGALFVGGAAGMELFAGVFGHLYQENGAIGRAVTHLEELLEMAAIVVWIYTLASYIETYVPLEIRFSMFQNASPASSPEAQPTAADSQAAVLSGKAPTTVGQ